MWMLTTGEIRMLEFETRMQEMRSAYPQSAPSAVVDFQFGDYFDAKIAFDRAGAFGWTPDYVHANRDIITFVNDDAFLFLLPRFAEASYVKGEINADVFDYLLYGLMDRLASCSAPLFNEDQTKALDRVLVFFEALIGDEEPIWRQKLTTIRRAIVGGAA